MELKIVLLILAISYASCHTFFSTLIIDGQSLNDKDCMRGQRPGAEGGVYRNSPVNDVNTFPRGLLSDNMTCGFLPYANQPANRKCAVAAGSQVGLQWWHNSPGAGDDIMDTTHKGPVMVYLARSDTGKGNVWFKIYEDGYTNGQWASNKLIANRGRVSVTIPSDLVPGNYLLRGEVIALHDGDKPHGSQPYVGCAELTISGNGKADPSLEGVAIPGAYAESDPGIAFNTYTTYNSYIIPGPPVYQVGTGPEAKDSKSSSLSGGAKFGIAIAIIAVVALGAVVGLFLLKKNKPETFDKIASPFGKMKEKISEKISRA